MKPDKTQSGIDALRILANAISNESDIHIRNNGDIREKRFDEKFLNYLGIKKTPKDWETSAKNSVKEKISADLKLLNQGPLIGRKLASDEEINQFIESYLQNVKSRTPNKPIFDEKFQNLNDQLLSLSEVMHGKNTPNFRASLHLTGGSATAAAQITMFANDLKKRWGLNSVHALTAGFQIWHLCSKNHDVTPEQAFHIAITAGNLVKKQILQPPKNPEELKSNLDAAAEIMQASISLKKNHNSPDPFAHACQRYLAREKLASALPVGMKPNLIEGNPVKNRYEIPDTMRTEFTKSMAELPIKASEVLTERGVTRQFHRDCIQNPFEFTFPDLTENAETSSSVRIIHNRLDKKVTREKKTASIVNTELSTSTAESRQSDVQDSLKKLAEASAKLSKNTAKNAEIKLSISRIFEQATLNFALSLACNAAATRSGDIFLLTHAHSQYPINNENPELSSFLQSASIDDQGDLTQEITYFSRIFSITTDLGDEIPVNRHIDATKPIDPNDPTTYCSKFSFTMKYSARELASGMTKPEIQQAYVEHSFDMSSSVMELP
jgi:hypothetical protein